MNALCVYGGCLYLGGTMDFELTPDQELFIASAKEYAEKYFTPEAIKQAYEVDHHISLEAAMAFRELGFMHLGLPEEVGGIPCDKFTLVLLMESCMKKKIMDVVNNVPSTSVAVTAISEPGAGSDNNAMTCVTVKQPDGTYLLNGQKTWVTIGHLAVYTILVAKDEDPSYENDNYSLWMIPNDIEGYTFGGLEKIGQQIVPFVDCFFDNVVLTEDMPIARSASASRSPLATSAQFSSILLRWKPFWIMCVRVSTR